jgi:hypothetical protein
MRPTHRAWNAQRDDNWLCTHRVGLLLYQLGLQPGQLVL